MYRDPFMNQRQTSEKICLKSFSQVLGLIIAAVKTALVKVTNYIFMALDDGLNLVLLDFSTAFDS